MRKCSHNKLHSGVIYLIGDLGLEKQHSPVYFQKFGHQGSVKAKTYTLVEPYTIQRQRNFPFDLYRLDDPYELELMGIRDCLETPDALFYFEWPSKVVILKFKAGCI